MNASKIAIGGNTGISPPHPTESDVSPPPTGEPISNILAYQWLQYSEDQEKIIARDEERIDDSVKAWKLSMNRKYLHK